MCPTRVFYKSVSYKGVKNCLGVCFRERVGIRVRGFHLVWDVGFFSPPRWLELIYPLNVGEPELGPP